MTIDQLNQATRNLLPGTLGIELTGLSPEKVCARMPVREEVCTIGGILHGGAIMAFADTLGAVATVLNLPPDTTTTTIESKTNFLRAAKAGTEVTAETTPLHRGRTTMVWQTRISNGPDRLVAVVTQSQLVLSAKR